MNERIRVLAEQAGIYKLDLSDETEYWIIEKFAELIVKDCARVADIADENKCEWIGGTILTHFGVES